MPEKKIDVKLNIEAENLKNTTTDAEQLSQKMQTLQNEIDSLVSERLQIIKSDDVEMVKLFTEEIQKLKKELFELRNPGWTYVGDPEKPRSIIQKDVANKLEQERLIEKMSHSQEWSDSAKKYIQTDKTIDEERTKRKQASENEAKIKDESEKKKSDERRQAKDLVDEYITYNEERMRGAVGYRYRRRKLGNLLRDRDADDLSEDEQREAEELFEDMQSYEKKQKKLRNIKEKFEPEESEDTAKTDTQIAPIISSVLRNLGFGGGATAVSLLTGGMTAAGIAGAIGAVLIPYLNAAGDANRQGALAQRMGMIYQAYAPGVDWKQVIGLGDSDLQRLGMEVNEIPQLLMPLARVVGPKAHSMFKDIAQWSVTSGMMPAEGIQQAVALKSMFGDMDIVSLLSMIRGTSENGAFFNRTGLVSQNLQGLMSGFAGRMGYVPGGNETTQLLGMYSGVAETAGETGVLSGPQYINQWFGAAQGASGVAEAFMMRAFMKYGPDNKDYMTFLRWKGTAGGVSAAHREAIDEAGPELAPAMLMRMGFITSIQAYDKMGDPTRKGSVSFASTQDYKLYEDEFSAQQRQLMVRPGYQEMGAATVPHPAASWWTRLKQDVSWRAILDAAAGSPFTESDVKVPYAPWTKEFYRNQSQQNQMIETPSGKSVIVINPSKEFQAKIDTINKIPNMDIKVTPQGQGTE